MSSSSQHGRLRHKASTDKTVEDGSLRTYQHYSSAERNPAADKHEVESSVIMVVAGKKADAQRENRVANTEHAPQFLAPSVVSPSAMPFTTAFGLASTPTTLSGASTSLLTPLFQSTEQKNTLSESIASAQSSISSVSAPVSASRSAPTYFPPALLAFTLIFSCLFCLAMFLAFRRMCYHRQSRVQLATPLVLDDATALGSGHRSNSKAMRLDKHSLMKQDAAVRFDNNQPEYFVESKTDTVGNPRDTANDAFLSVNAETLNAPLPAHVAGSVHHTSLQVPHPHHPRPYHRRHPGNSGDRDAFMPLMAAKSFENRDNHRARSESKAAQSNLRAKGKGKENSMQNTGSNHGGRHRSSFMAHSMDLPRLSAISEVADSSEICASDAGARHEFSSSFSIGNMKGDEANVPESVDPPLPTAGTIAVDIGLAMLTGFSSPIVGLGFDPKSMSGSPSPSGHLANDATSDYPGPPSNTIDPGEAAMLSHLFPSTSSGSRGLAYLASGSSTSLMGKSTEECDTTEECSSNQELDARALAHARLVEQLNLAIDSDANVHTPPALSFKTPFLPTLSEMALSRADPLYESVTNELFASYGVRMSTASGAGRMSRASTRISRMLSWFEGAAPDETISVGGRISDDSEWLSERDLVSQSAGGGVQPLRINGKHV